MSSAVHASSNPNKPSVASRYLLVFLIGLVVGIIAVVMAMRAWESRKTAQDQWHDSVMNLLTVHTDQLKAKLQGNRCTTADALPNLQSLRIIGNDLEPSFPGLADDQRFKQHASKFRATLDAALANPPSGCAATEKNMQDIGAACKACHQDFRS